MSIVAKKIMMGSGAVAEPSDDEFNRVSFLSHFDGANNGVNNVFDDGSTSNHTITANGNVTQGSFGPFARPDGEWGVSFDGTNDGLRLQSSDFGISTEAFTAECWVFPTKVPDNSDSFMWCMNATQGNAGGNTWALRANNGKVQIFTVSSSTLSSKDSTASLNINAWNHLALSRSGTTMYVALNGTVESATCASSLNNQQYLHIGCAAANDFAYFFQGVISNARYLVGTALYTSDYTVPTGKLTAITNTDLLTCQSNRFVDNSASGHAITITGEPAVTAFGAILTSSVYEPAVNGGSAYIAAGDSDYLSMPAQTIPTGNFTVEGWYYLDGTQSNKAIISQGSSGNAGRTFVGIESVGGTQILKFQIGGSEVNGPASVANQWTHFCVTYNGSAIELFQNGVSAGTTSRSGNSENVAMVIGRLGTGWAGGYGVQGYISDIRVSGVVRQSSDFTPPTAPLTNVDSNVKLLLNMANGQAIDSAAQNNLTLVGTAKTSTAQKKFGTASMLFDGTGDYALTDVTPLGTGMFTIECFYHALSKATPMGLFEIAASALPGNITGLAMFNRSSTYSYNWGFFCGGTQTNSTTAPDLNTFYHVALVRDSNNLISMYVNGTSVCSATNATNLVGTVLTIGDYYSAAYGFHGYLDEFRISHGVARYTSNFTAPSEPFADKGQ